MKDIHDDCIFWEGSRDVLFILQARVDDGTFVYCFGECL